MAIDRTAPAYSLRIDNDPLPDEAVARLESIEYEDAERMDKIVLKFQNMDGGLDMTLFPKNGRIEFRHGYANALSTPKYLPIASTNGWRKGVTVTGLGYEQIFNTEQHSQRWDNATLAEVVGDIAKRNELIPKTEERKNSAGKVLRFGYYQGNVQDLAFLYTLADGIGYTVWVEVDTLYFMPRLYWQKPYREIIYENFEGDLLDFEPRMTGTILRGAFSAGGINLETKQQIQVVEEGTTRRMYVLDGTLFDAEKAIKANRDITRAFWVRAPLRNSDEADDILQGQWTKEQEDQITATLTHVGDPNLLARRVVLVSNVGVWSGRYYVKSVKHTMDRSGYISTMSLGRNATWDEGQKYARSAFDEISNKERPTVAVLQKATEKGPKNPFWERILKVK